MKEYDKHAFVADIIKALEEAELASETPKDRAAVAREAYSKLHYDYPVSMTTPTAPLATLSLAGRLRRSSPPTSSPP